MSKITWGVMAGLALATAAAVPLATAGAGAPAPQATVNTAATVAPATPAAVQVAAVTTTKAAGPAPTLPRVLKITRIVKLTLPTASKVGANVTGFIQVLDSNTVVTSPVAGVEVALQKKTAGAKAYVDVADDLTDANGQVTVSFTARANTTWRAVLKPATGAPLYSTTVLTTASAQLTWASRPDVDVVHGAKAQYSFRITPVTAPTAHLEYASSTTPTKWTLAKSLPVPPNGVVTQSIVFPFAGTWLVRGATASTPANAAGYTTTLTVTAS